jgi:hypothetical protein
VIVEKFSGLDVYSREDLSLPSIETILRPFLFVLRCEKDFFMGNSRNKDWLPAKQLAVFRLWFLPVAGRAFGRRETFLVSTGYRMVLFFGCPAILSCKRKGVLVPFGYFF